jgi:hypothetical protein
MPHGHRRGAHASARAGRSRMATSPILGRRRTLTRLGSPTRPTSRAPGASDPAVQPPAKWRVHQAQRPGGRSAHIPRRRLGSGSRPVPAAVRGVLEAVAPQTDRPAQPLSKRAAAQLGMDHASPSETRTAPVLTVDRIACTSHGICASLRRPGGGRRRRAADMQGPRYTTSPRSRPHGTGRLVRRQPTAAHDVVSDPVRLDIATVRRTGSHTHRRGGRPVRRPPGSSRAGHPRSTAEWWSGLRWCVSSSRTSTLPPGPSRSL